MCHLCWSVLWSLLISSWLVSHEFPGKPPCIQPTSLPKKCIFLLAQPFWRAPIHSLQHCCCTNYHICGVLHHICVVTMSSQICSSVWPSKSSFFFSPCCMHLATGTWGSPQWSCFHRRSVRASAVMLATRHFLTSSHMSLLIRLWLLSHTEHCLRTSLLD